MASVAFLSAFLKALKNRYIQELYNELCTYILLIIYAANQFFRDWSSAKKYLIDLFSKVVPKTINKKSDDDEVKYL